MKCKICNNETNYFASGKVLNKFNVKFFYCHNCGFLFTEEPYWLTEAYKEPINISYDTGNLQRSIYLSRFISLLFFF